MKLKWFEETHDEESVSGRKETTCKLMMLRCYETFNNVYLVGVANKYGVLQVRSFMAFSSFDWHFTMENRANFFGRISSLSIEYLFE